MTMYTVYIYIYMYIFTYMCIWINIYIYIYICKYTVYIQLWSTSCMCKVEKSNELQVLSLWISTKIQQQAVPDRPTTIAAPHGSSQLGPAARADLRCESKQDPGGTLKIACGWLWLFYDSQILE